MANTVTIGEQIRRLRIQEKMTQEELAENLNVSFQTVSRWENGLSSPDLSLIPVIARFFNVTTDFLLGMNERNAEIEKDRLEDQYQEAFSEGKLGLCMQLMEEARQEYPRDCHFMVNQAEIMNWYYESGDKVLQEEYKEKKYEAQIFSLCRHVLEESRKDVDRYRAIYLLCRCHERAGNTDEAARLASSAADLMHCKEVLLGEILNGGEKLQRLQKNMLLCVEYVADILIRIAVRKEYGFTEKLTADEKIWYVVTANRLYDLFIPDGNALIHHRDYSWNYRRLAELYLLKEDKDTAYECLAKAKLHAEKFDQLKSPADGSSLRYTSSFLNTVECDRRAYGRSYMGTEMEQFKFRLKELSRYFAGDERFTRLQEE